MVLLAHDVYDLPLGMLSVDGTFQPHLARNSRFKLSTMSWSCWVLSGVCISIGNKIRQMQGIRDLGPLRQQAVVI